MSVRRYTILRDRQSGEQVDAGMAAPGRGGEVEVVAVPDLAEWHAQRGYECTAASEGQRCCVEEVVG